MKKYFLCTLSLALFTLVFAQYDDSLQIKKISDEILTNGQAYENLRVLCKKVGPRLSGSANAAKSIEYTAQMLKQAGADTVYLQEIMVPHWVRGKKEEAHIILTNGIKRRVNICALGNAVGTGSKGLTAQVVEVKNFDELKQLGVDGVKGKIVFFNFPMNPTYIQTFRAYSEAGAYRGNGPIAAAKLGAVACMVRSLASNPDDYPHTGATRYNDSFPKIPAIAISTNDADFLSNQIKQQKNLQLFFKTTCEMLPDVKSYNVIGEIKGYEKPDEIITIGGHLDSWDLAEGANDDGSGCVQSIEIIRVFKTLGIHPKRTIRAVMFMNEENGLRGGRKYAEVAEQKKEKHLFALESDEGGFTPRGIGISVPEEKRAKINSWLPLFRPYGVYEFLPEGGGADIGGLKRLGAALGNLVPDSQRYFDIHHSALDVFENVSRRELLLGAVNMAAIIFLIDKYGI